MNRKKSLTAILVLVIGVGVGIISYYLYQGTHYVSTDDARLTGDLYKVVPRISGEITNVYIEEGDVVQENQTISLLDTANLDSSTIDKAVVKAPIKGTVVKLYSKEQELATPSQPLALLMDLNSIYVTANIEETDIKKIKTGQDVLVSLDALDGQKLKGKVRKIGSVTNSTLSLLPSVNTSGNFNKVTQRIPIEVAIFKPNELELIPGTNVEIKISIS